MATELVPIEPYSAPPTLFGSDNPTYIMASATAKANALAQVVKDKQLASVIGNRHYVRVEGWTLLGSLLGVFPVCVWTRKLEDGWEARVEARTLAGQVVGSAEAQCCRDEQTWRNRSEFALRSMAQTRATSKALRSPLGFVMSMAGFEATPAEEMHEDAPRPRPTAAPRRAQPERRNLWQVFEEMGFSNEEVINESQILFEGRGPTELNAEEKRILSAHLAELKQPPELEE